MMSKPLSPAPPGPVSMLHASIIVGSLCASSSCDCTGAVGGIVLAILLALCICFVVRRKRNKQVGEKRVAAKQQKEKKKLKQQQKKKAPGAWLGFLKRKKGGPGTGMLHMLLIEQRFLFGGLRGSRGGELGECGMAGR